MKYFFGNENRLQYQDFDESGKILIFNPTNFWVGTFEEINMDSTLGGVALWLVDVLIVEERNNHGLRFGKQYCYLGKHW